MDNTRKLKRSLLSVGKWTGGFQLSRWLTRRGLRILCYHGFGVGDETVFRPKLFIHVDTFERRLKALRNSGVPVLSLEEAVNLLYQNKLPDFATVITIDDGFDGVSRHAAGLLKQYSMPATVYVTSYYSLKQTPIFRLLVQYMFWKTRLAKVNFPSDIFPDGSLDLSDRAARDRGMWQIINRAEAERSEDERVALTQRLADLLAVDIEPAIRDRVFHIMNAGQISSLPASGLDVQIHTHRHRFPEEEAQARAEIVDNVSVLKPLVTNPLRHFCYPSGFWSKVHWPVLSACGMKSATTCIAGLNYPETPPLALRRWLDAEDTSAIEFDAELAGFSELLRQGRSRVRGS
jgi:peptidoglycan/xylan/chitin deacetylase (PgdA/CDA1 family)